jgi:chorismate mutase/prephenate dehydratase
VLFLGFFNAGSVFNYERRPGVGMGKSKAKTDENAGRKRRALSPSGDLASRDVLQLDAELVRLVQERAQRVVDAQAQKPLPPGPYLPPAPDEATLAKLFASTPGPLPERCLRAVLREIASGCRALVREPRVAILGPWYSYSHLAAIHRFGQSVEFVPVNTISAVFEEVSQKHSDFGIVPIENSTDGRVADTLDMFTRMQVRICGEVELRIHHALLAKCTRTEVKEVYSKPQAISQCRNWLAKHLPNARLIEVTSTSTAAQLACEKAGAAAIASMQAGVHHELTVLAESIEDNPTNTTRFAMIGNEIPPRTGNDLTALLFQLEHRPGTLSDVMTIFKRSRVNMSWIDSFPIPGSNRGYHFFVEVEGHESDPRLRRALALIRKKTVQLEILGSFPATKPVE